jgi:hypothetical protein
VGDPIDLTPFYPFIREAARRGGKTAWVGWLTGFFLTALGLLDSVILLTIGIVTLVSMTIWTGYHVRELRRYQRRGRSETEPGTEADARR